MKLEVKLILNFFFITLLVVFVGISNIYTTNLIQKNNKIGTEIIEITGLLDKLLIHVLELIETENLDDYNLHKSHIENIRKEFDVSYEKNSENILKISKSFDENLEEFTNISNRIIAVHKERLIQNRELAEKLRLEKDSRHKMRASVSTSKNLTLTQDILLMEYYSKEALYQYKDKEYIDEWLVSIQNIKNKVEEPGILQEDIDFYQFVAQRAGEIIIEQKEIETEESLKVAQLMDIINRFEESRGTIISAIISQNQSVLKKAYLILLIVITIIFILSIVFGLYIARSISKPILKLHKGTEIVAGGNLNYRTNIKSKDEIGQLASAFNQMTEKLREHKKITEKEIREKTKQLKNVNIILEKKVKERTIKLEKLTKELDEKVKDRTKELEFNKKELENSKKELENKNKELEKTLEDFYTIRISMQKEMELGKVQEENKKINKE